MAAIIVAYVLSFFIFPTLQPDRTQAVSGVEVAPTLEVSPSNTIAFNVTPGTFNSANQTLSVKTTNYTGYTLTLSANSSADLVNTKGDTIPTITLPNGSASITSSAFTTGYGYSLNATDYKPVLTGDGSTLDSTDGPNSTANEYTLTLGAKVDVSVPTGVYTKALTITATANEAGYIITYNKNAGTDTVNNMPSPNPQENTVTGLSATLSSVTPTRTGYTFLGWSTNSSATTASYQPGGSLTLDPETSNQVTLYAVWSKTYVLNYDANNGSGAPNSDSGSSATGSYTFTISSTEPTRDNYNFLGWSESDSATTADYSAGDEYTVSTTPKTLYAVWESAAPPTMEDFQCSALGSVGSTTTLTDSRDGTEYKIAKLADNNCWMVQNMRLNLANLQEDISPSNTNNPTAAFVTAANAKPASSSSWCTTDSAACDDQVLYNTTNIGSTTSDGDGHTYNDYGVYYNWFTATAGNGTYSKSSGVAAGDICPRGWHLPTGNSGGEFSNLDSKMGGTGAYQSTSTAAARWRADPVPDFVYSGYFSSSGAYSRGSSGYGYYWSSTASSSNDAYGLSFGSGYVYPGTNNSNKYYGFAVRCVAGTEYSLEFDANNGSNAPATQYVNLASGSSAIFNITTSEPTRSGYLFAGWATSASATAADYQPGGTYTASSATSKLYAVWKSGTKMQDWQGCSTLATGATTTLVDIRDYTSYTVAKLKDDKCWMTQNMRFDFSKYGDKINTENTHSPTTTFVTSAKAKPASSSSWCTSNSSSCDDKISYNTSNIGGTSCPTGNCDTYGVYYNWFTATAGNGTYSKSSGATSGDICPHGWHLPTGTSSGEFYTLNTKQNSGSTSSPSGLTASPANFVYSGYFNSSSAGSRGSSGNGVYWSSTASSSNYAYSLLFYSGSVYPGTRDGYKYNGFAVRCVADK